MGGTQVFALLCYFGFLVIVVAKDDEYETNFGSELDYDSESDYYYDDEKPNDCKFKMKLLALKSYFLY